MTTDQPRIYRLTRPDGLGFFRRHSATQFGIGCSGIGLGLLAIVAKMIGTPGRVGLGAIGCGLLLLAIGRTPSGEDLLDLLAPLVRFMSHRLRGADRWAAALAPFGGDVLPPLFAGITLTDFIPDPTSATARGGALRSPARAGLILDRADGSVSVVLRVYGEGFLLCDPLTQDERVASFGVALASLGREESPIRRVAWSQFAAPATFDEHFAYLEATERADPDEAMHLSYSTLVEETLGTAIHTEVLITLTANIAETRTTRTTNGRVASSREGRLHSAALRLLEEAELFAGELANAGLVTTGPLPAGSIARVLRERLDPSTRHHLSRRGRSLVDALGLVTPENGFPLAIEEHSRSLHTDDCWHRLLRVAEWPRSGVRADWLSSFLCEREVARSFTVIFTPQSRRHARRQALAVATRVGASIDERATKGRRVGAEERRAQLAAEALDEELEAGAEMELVLGLVDVCAESEDALELATERTLQVGADSGLELRTVGLRQAEALVAALPIGRVVLGRAK